MRFPLLFLILGCLAAAQNTSPPSEIKTGTIDGTVLSAAGAPVAGATVYALPRKGVHHALVTFVRTDSSGRFRLEQVPPGETVIYAYDLEEGYLDPHAAFNSGNKYLAVVTVAPDAVTPINVTLGPKCAYLVGSVHNSQDGSSVRNASFMLKRADDPNIWLSTSPVEETGKFRLGVPSGTPIDLEVNAAHFTSWRPGPSQTQVLKAGLNAGEEYSIDIQLKPVSPQ
jgi:Carboxypeptidase regulatory-like domain